MITDVEDRLRTELAIDAANAQLSAPEWNGFPVLASQPQADPDGLAQCRSRRASSWSPPAPAP